MRMKCARINQFTTRLQMHELIHPIEFGLCISPRVEPSENQQLAFFFSHAMIFNLSLSFPIYAYRLSKSTAAARINVYKMEILYSCDRLLFFFTIACQVYHDIFIDMMRNLHSTSRYSLHRYPSTDISSIKFQIRENENKTKQNKTHSKFDR